MLSRRSPALARFPGAGKDEESALAAMAEEPRLIRRPIWWPEGGTPIVGFDADAWERSVSRS